MTSWVEKVVEIHCEKCRATGRTRTRLGRAVRRDIYERLVLEQSLGELIERPEGGFKIAPVCRRCSARPQIRVERIEDLISGMDKGVVKLFA